MCSFDLCGVINKVLVDEVTADKTSDYKWHFGLDSGNI